MNPQRMKMKDEKNEINDVDTHTDEVGRPGPPLDTTSHKNNTTRKHTGDTPR